MFKDYSYRILPSFAQMFNNGDAIAIKAHLLPAPEAPLVDDVSQVLLHPPTFDSIGNSNLNRGSQDGRTITTDEVLTMGAAEMLRASNKLGSLESHSLFVCGTEAVGQKRYIRVDLERDHVHDVEVDCSVDLDSAIYTTHRLNF